VTPVSMKETPTFSHSADRNRHRVFVPARPLDSLAVAVAVSVDSKDETNAPRSPESTSGPNVTFLVVLLSAAFRTLDLG